MDMKTVLVGLCERLLALCISRKNNYIQLYDFSLVKTIFLLVVGIGRARQRRLAKTKENRYSLRVHPPRRQR